MQNLTIFRMLFGGLRKLPKFETSSSLNESADDYNSKQSKR